MDVKGEIMDIDIWAAHDEGFSVEVNTFKEEKPWHTLLFGKSPNRMKLFINDDQLREVAASITKALKETELCREGEHSCEPDWNAERGYHYVCGENS